MSFKTTAVITSVVTFVLGVGYLFAGALLVGRWEIEPTGSVLLLGRRMGALYLGLSVLYFLARNTPASATRTALSTGVLATCSLLAILGIYEHSTGRAGAAILVSVAIEALLALAFLRILLVDRRNARRG